MSPRAPGPSCTGVRTTGQSVPPKLYLLFPPVCLGRGRANPCFPKLVPLSLLLAPNLQPGHFPPSTSIPLLSAGSSMRTAPGVFGSQAKQQSETRSAPSLRFPFLLQRTRLSSLVCWVLSVRFPPSRIPPPPHGPCCGPCTGPVSFFSSKRVYWRATRTAVLDLWSDGEPHPSPEGKGYVSLDCFNGL